jgi:hypothetical protein
MPSANVVWAISTVARVLAIVPGLWFAGQLLPRIVAALPAWAAELVRPRGSIRFAFWLILGSLFTAPLIDLISFLFSLTEIFSAANWSAQQPFTAGFGSVPFPLYLILNDLVTLAAYGLAVWAGWRFLEKQRARGNEPFEMSAIETAFVLMAGGAVVDRAVSLTMLASMEVPFSIATTRPDFGPAGFFASWGAGLVLLAVILILLYRSVPDTEPTPRRSSRGEWRI